MKVILRLLNPEESTLEVLTLEEPGAVMLELLRLTIEQPTIQLVNAVVEEPGEWDQWEKLRQAIELYAMRSIAGPAA